MAISNRVKKTMVAAGIAMSAFSYVANAHSGEDHKEPVNNNTALATPPSKQTDSDKRLTNALEVASKYVMEQMERKAHPDKTYEAPEHTPETLSREIIASIKAGADANYDYTDQPYAAIDVALFLAYEFRNPDVLEEFLKHEGNARMANKGGTSLMDMAFENFSRAQKRYEFNQIDYRSLEIAAKLIGLLDQYGASFDDAKQLAKILKLEKYEDLAKNIVSLEILKNEGLISEEAFNNRLSLPPELAKIAQETTELNPDFFTKYGATMAHYPDAVPGGPEPYEIQKGDTLQSLAQRFVNAMDADNEQHALEMITAKNGVAIDTDLTKGETLLIPVPPEHQMAQIPITVFDTLTGVVIRISELLKIDDLEEVYELLIKENNITNKNATEIFKIGNVISIPATKENKAQTITPQTYDTLRGSLYIMRTVLDSHKKGNHKASGSMDRALEETMRLNGFSSDLLKSGEGTLKTGDKIWVTLFNDGYNQMKELTPPKTYDPDHKINLIVIESEEEDAMKHRKQVYRTAANTAYALNPSVGFSNFHLMEGDLGASNAFKRPDALRILLNLDGSPLQERVIFSHSMSDAIEAEKTDKILNRIQPDHIIYEAIRLNLDTINKAKPIIFAAAGNFHLSIQGKEIGDGRYAQSYALMHSPRTVNVGASKIDNKIGKANIWNDTSFGGDICFQSPVLFTAQANGTSFTAPEGAATVWQLMEWYSNLLSFEEIMATGYMVADRDILDFDVAEGYFKEAPDGKKLPIPAIFNTNGGGLPVHGRCGAGNWDADSVVLWREKLDKMVEFKQSRKEQHQLYSENIEFGEPLEVSHNEKSGKSEYIYRVNVPENMTLGKLTFLLPQNKGERSAEIKVKTPSGFERVLPKSAYDVVSTQWFNYEDVKVGDVIEIKTEYPLAETAGIYLHGTPFSAKEKNPLQLMREHLHAEGILPEPLKTMHGNKVMTDKQAKLEL